MIRIYNGARNFVLFGPERYVAIYNRIRYVISQKIGITYVFSHNYARLKVDSYYFLPIEKISTLCNVIMLIKSVRNKDQNHCYYNIFVEKLSYKWP